MNKKVRIDGVDFGSMTIIKKINVWKDYQDRSAGVLYKVKHKEKVCLIKIFKDGYVEIRKRCRKESGFVNALFIKEIKYHAEEKKRQEKLLKDAIA